MVRPANWQKELEEKVTEFFLSIAITVGEGKLPDNFIAVPGLPLHEGWLFPVMLCHKARRSLIQETS